MQAVSQSRMTVTQAKVNRLPGATDGGSEKATCKHHSPARCQEQLRLQAQLTPLKSWQNWRSPTKCFGSVKSAITKEKIWCAG